MEISRFALRDDVVYAVDRAWSAAFILRPPGNVGFSALALAVRRPPRAEDCPSRNAHLRWLQPENLRTVFASLQGVAIQNAGIRNYRRTPRTRPATDPHILPLRRIIRQKIR